MLARSVSIRPDKVQVARPVPPPHQVFCEPCIADASSGSATAGRVNTKRLIARVGALPRMKPYASMPAGALILDAGRVEEPGAEALPPEFGRPLKTEDPAAAKASRASP